MTRLILFVCSAVVVILESVDARGQNPPGGLCTVRIRGSVAAASLIPEFTLSENDESRRCIGGDGKDLCEARISCDAKEALLTVIAPNFKKYTRNLVGLVFRDGTAQVDIGQVRLQPSELPTVVQVVRSSAQDGSVRFQIVLHNSLKREVFVQSVAFDARRGREPGLVGCAVGGVAVFRVDNIIRLSAHGGKVLASGSFQEMTQGAGFTIGAQGEVSLNLCGGEADFFLRLPTAFTIPQEEYSAVEIRLPARFNLEFVKESPPMGRAGHAAAELSDPLAYDRYVFRFTTTRTEELEIVGSYVASSLGEREQRFERLLRPPFR